MKGGVSTSRFRLEVEIVKYQVISRVLMYGKGGNVKFDIPLGSVYGKPAKGNLSNVGVGRNTMMTTSPKSQ